jgi:hypothetical protein
VFQYFECHSFYVKVLEEVFMKLQQLLKRLIPMLIIALFPVAGAQSIWGGVNAELPFSGGAGIYASLHVGAGYNLPLGLGTIGLEVTPFALRGDAQSFFRVGAVLRDIPVPFLPISFRAEAGLERLTPGGLFDFATGSTSVYLGGGARYTVFGPLGINLAGRLYFGGSGAASAFTVSLGADFKI